MCAFYYSLNWALCFSLWSSNGWWRQALCSTRIGVCIPWKGIFSIFLHNSAFSNIKWQQIHTSIPFLLKFFYFFSEKWSAPIYQIIHSNKDMSNTYLIRHCAATNLLCIHLCNPCLWLMFDHFHNFILYSVFALRYLDFHFKYLKV